MINFVIKKIKNVYANIVLFFVDWMLKIIISFLKEAIVAKGLDLEPKLEKHKIVEILKMAEDICEENIPLNIKRSRNLTEQMQKFGGVGMIWHVGKNKNNEAKRAMPDENLGPRLNIIEEIKDEDIISSED